MNFPLSFGKSNMVKILKENKELLEKAGIKIYFPKPNGKTQGLNISKVHIDEDWAFKLWMKK